MNKTQPSKYFQDQDFQNSLLISLPVLLILFGLLFFSYQNNSDVDAFFDNFSSKSDQQIITFAKRFGPNVRHSVTQESLIVMLLQRDGFSKELFDQVLEGEQNWATVDFSGNNLIGQVVLSQEQRNKTRLRNPAHQQKVWNREEFLLKLEYLKEKGIEPRVQVARKRYQLSEYIQNSRFLQ